MKRLEYLDQMKGIAIFSMVMGHVLLFSFGISRSTITNVLFINMPIFFYVSGYLLYKEIDNVKDLMNRLQHKAARLLPPWLLVTLVMAGIQGWNFFNTLCVFYWFFYVLFILTLLLIILEFLLFRHIKNSYAYCFSLAVIPLTFAVIKFTGSYSYFPAPDLCQYSVPFILGWICRKYTKAHKFVLDNQILFVVALIIFFVCWYKRESMNNYIMLVGALSGIIVIQSILYKREVGGGQIENIEQVRKEFPGNLRFKQLLLARF